MAFRFFRSFGGRWLRFNVSKRGVSCSIGKKGLATTTINSVGKLTTNINAPVQGLSYRTESDLKNKNLTSKQQSQCAQRPFGTHKYNRRELEALHVAAVNRIAELEAKLTGEH
ncbi:DUF4236 domain-containing protein [Shewanella sp. UCD-KL12]|uniref:DUF4236 domain-containing protein n=1 Tax=Shewanella sp. UCD-KL12 TaxID=1917163 RepID=UPI0009709AB5|nr:DUF4236 domain-containing protein [Shewanella sp. UCD-KL12]